MRFWMCVQGLGLCSASGCRLVAFGSLLAVRFAVFDVAPSSDIAATRARQRIALRRDGMQWSATEVFSLGLFTSIAAVSSC